MPPPHSRFSEAFHIWNSTKLSTPHTCVAHELTQILSVEFYHSHMYHSISTWLVNACGAPPQPELQLHSNCCLFRLQVLYTYVHICCSCTQQSNKQNVVYRADIKGKLKGGDGMYTQYNNMHHTVPSPSKSMTQSPILSHRSTCTPDVLASTKLYVL